MNDGNDLNLLDLYFRKKINILKISDHLILKSSFSPQKCKNYNNLPPSRNIKFSPPKKEFENSGNINNNNNKEEQIKLKIQKYKKILLPSLSTTNKSAYKSLLNSKINIKQKEEDKPKLIKIRKLNAFTFSPLKSKSNNKKLKKLYKENLDKKRKLDKYKEYKNKNIKNFSLRRYNEKLILLSSMNLSEDNYNVFKKNMKCIEKAMNGRVSFNNKYKNLFDNIENNYKPYSKKSKKYISLSEAKAQKNVNSSND